MLYTASVICSAYLSHPGLRRARALRWKDQHGCHREPDKSSLKPHTEHNELILVKKSSETKTIKKTAAMVERTSLGISSERTIFYYITDLTVGRRNVLEGLCETVEYYYFLMFCRSWICFASLLVW